MARVELFVRQRAGEDCRDGAGNHLDKTSDTQDIRSLERSSSPNTDGLLFEQCSARQFTARQWTPAKGRYTGGPVLLKGRLRSHCIRSGMNRGKWRDMFEPQLAAAEPSLPVRQMDLVQPEV
jgi:hypothetical protein